MKILMLSGPWVDPSEFLKMKFLLFFYIVLFFTNSVFAGELLEGKTWELEVAKKNEPYVNQLKDFLEIADSQFGQFFNKIGIPRVRNSKLKVTVFPDFQSYRAFQEKNSNSQSKTAFYSLFNGRVYTWKMENSHHILKNVYHESTHHYMRDYTVQENIPRCVDEGIAEIFEAGEIRGTQFQIGQIPDGWAIILKQSFAKKKLQPFSYFMGMTPKEFVSYQDNEFPKMHIAQCWGMSHFLFFGDNGRWISVLKGLLSKKNLLDDSSKAMQDSIPPGFQYSDLLDHWQKFAQNPH